MHSKDYIRLFHTLVSLAEEHCRSSHGTVKNIEPGFLAVLMYIKNAPPELQKKAEMEFVKNVQGLGGHYVKRRASNGLITYCMRELKFELVREAAIKMKNAPENASHHRILFRSAMDRIIAAYEPEWDKDCLYDYYRRLLPNRKQTIVKYMTKHGIANNDAAEMIEFMRKRDAEDNFSEECIIFLRKMIVVAEERRRLSRGGGEALDPGYFAVLMYIKGATSSMRKRAEREFVKLVEAKALNYVPGTSTCGLITYCMRELKYKKVRAAALKWKKASECAGRLYLTFRRELDGIIKACDSRKIWF